MPYEQRFSHAADRYSQQAGQIPAALDEDAFRVARPAKTLDAVIGPVPLRPTPPNGRRLAVMTRTCVLMAFEKSVDGRRKEDRIERPVRVMAMSGTMMSPADMCGADQRQ